MRKDSQGSLREITGYRPYTNMPIPWVEFRIPSGNTKRPDHPTIFQPLAMPRPQGVNCSMLPQVHPPSKKNTIAARRSPTFQSLGKCTYSFRRRLLSHLVIDGPNLQHLFFAGSLVRGKERCRSDHEREMKHISFADTPLI